MNVRESVRISWRAITGHKLRSTLTTLGIVIGVASVIAFMVLGGAFEEDALGDIDTGDQSVVLVQTQGEAENAFGPQTYPDPIYTESDVEAIEEIDGVEFVGRSGTIPASQVAHDDQSTVSFLLSVTNPRSFSKNLTGFFVAGEAFRGEGEAVITTDLRESLGGDIGPGDEIGVMTRGTRETLTVTGVYQVENQGPTAGSSVYVPVDPYYDRTVETADGSEERAFTSLSVWIESVEDLTHVQSELETHFSSGESDAEHLVDDDKRIVVQTLDELLGQIGEIFDTLTTFIVGIAALSLIVGSIGIANIMIVSVTERTREIGIMKAIGARQRDLVQLFLVEAVILGVIGAALGVLVGLGGGYLLTSLIGFPMVYPTDWIAIAVVVGIAVGVLSGLYPAWRAARVDPIEALRHE